MKALLTLMAAGLLGAAVVPQPARAAHDHAGGTATAAARPGSAAQGRGGDGGGCKMMKGAQKGKPDGPGGGMGMMGGAGMGMMGMMAMHHGLVPALPPQRVAALGLDAGQRERLAALEKQNRQAQWSLLGDLREERLRLTELMGAQDPDPSTVTSQLRSVQAVEAKLMQARLTARRDAMGLLTPEQREMLLKPQSPAGHAGSGGDDKDDDAEDEHAAHH